MTFHPGVTRAPKEAITQADGVARHLKHVCSQVYAWPGMAGSHRRLARVRKSAQDEIDRLIRFRDETETKWKLEPGRWATTPTWSRT